MRRFSTTLISIGISAALIAAGIWFLTSWSGFYPFGHHRWFLPHGRWMGGGMGVVMILFWIIVLIALITFIYGIVSARSVPSGGDKDRADAFEILKRRYAAGDIDKTEYESKRRDLQM